MEVSLENGWGAPPTVSAIDYTNAGSGVITVEISVKDKAKVGQWDVRVGSGVLTGGLYVE
jgi:hypothetical protein